MLRSAIKQTGARNKVSKRHSVLVAEKEMTTRKPDTLVVESADTDVPPPTAAIRVDDRDTSIFIQNKKEVGPTVGSQTNIFPAFLSLNERLNNRESGHDATLDKHLRQDLNIASLTQEALDGLFELAVLREFLDRELAFGLSRLVLRQ